MKTPPITWSEADVQRMTDRHRDETAALRTKLAEAERERKDERHARLLCESNKDDVVREFDACQVKLAAERAARERAEAALRDIRELGGIGTAGQIARRYFDGVPAVPAATPGAPVCPACRGKRIILVYGNEEECASCRATPGAGTKEPTR